MSCIPKLLKLKGENEFLQLGRSPNMIEDGGEYEGYHFLITFTPLGHRCGYVAITPRNYIYKAKSYRNKKITNMDVHGGITYFDKPSNTFGTDKDCNDKWLGFDAAHYNDKIDFETLKKINESAYCAARYVENIRKKYMGNYTDDREIRSKDFMIDQCKQLIVQIKALG